MAIPTWLPDKKYYEYAYHKFFNPTVEFQNWTPWDEWTYPERDLSRFEHIIGKQLHHIRKQRVLDVACHLGYLSLFCLHNGASHVTGTNVREFELSVSKEIAGLANYPNCDFVWSDIYNQQEFFNLCNQHDTILLCGILYHINNHYEVLKTIADSDAKTLIIESDIGKSIEIGERPLVHWITEPTSNSTLAFEENKHTSFVGYPNHKWIEHALKSLGFRITYNVYFDHVTPNGSLTKRCVVVGEK
jgi:SAM-dependent methyltransferase